MLMRQLDRDLHPFGLSTNDYEILVELSEAPGTRLRMTELADLTAQSRSRLSHQITRMETKGLCATRTSGCSPTPANRSSTACARSGTATSEAHGPVNRATEHDHERKMCL